MEQLIPLATTMAILGSAAMTFGSDEDNYNIPACPSNCVKITR